MSCSILTLCVFSLVAQVAAANDSLAVLSEYARARSALNRVSATGSYSMDQVISHGDNVLRKGTSRIATEFRRDDDRYEFITTDVTSGTSAEQAGSTTQRLWDGTREYQVHSPTHPQEGSTDGYWVTVMKENTILTSLSLNLAYSTVTGVLHGDTKPINEILSTFGRGVVSMRREALGPNNCVVLTSDNENGEYEVWIDVERGYNIVRAIVTKGADDIYLGRLVGSYEFGPAKDDTTASGVMANRRTMVEAVTKIDNVILEQQGDRWVPVSAEHEKILKFSDGVVNDLKIACRFERLEIAPDFEKIDAFKVKVPNGTRVYLQAVPEIRYEWQDGEIKPFVDHAVLDVLDRTIEKYTENAATTKTESSAIGDVPVATGADIEREQNAQSTSETRPDRRWLWLCVLGVVLSVSVLGARRMHRRKIT